MRAAATEICWPSTARTTISVPSTHPGTRSPGRAATSGASSGSLAEHGGDRDGVGVQVEQPAAARHGDAEVAHVGEAQRALHAARRRATSSTTAVPCGQAQRAAVGARGGHLLDAGDGARREEREQLVDLDRRAVGQAQGDRAGAGRVRPAAPLPQLARRQREHLAHRVVELAHAREAGRERDLGEAELGRLDQRARRLRALRAGERERPGAELRGDEPVELAHAVAEPRGEPGDALAVDDAVADQPHRARDDVGARVPLRRARRGVGPAALAGPEAGALRRRRAAVEAHVGALGRDRRAARAAVDAGGGDAEVDPAVEAGVPALDRAVPVLAFLLHAAA